jgi:hypothetical protein
MCLGMSAGDLVADCVGCTPTSIRAVSGWGVGYTTYHPCNGTPLVWSERGYQLRKVCGQLRLSTRRSQRVVNGLWVELESARCSRIAGREQLGPPVAQHLPQPREGNV